MENFKINLDKTWSEVKNCDVNAEELSIAHSKHTKMIEINNIQCMQGISNFTIEHNGNVHTCAFYAKKLELPNILDYEIKQFFKYDLYNQLKSIKTPGISNGCNENCTNLDKCNKCTLHAFDYLISNDITCAWIEHNCYHQLYTYMQSGYVNVHGENL